MDTIGFITFVTLPIWALLMSGLTTNTDDYPTYKSYFDASLSHPRIRKFYAFYTPLMVCAVLNALGVPLWALWMVSVSVAVMASANMMERKGRSDFERYVWSLTGPIMLGYVLHESKLFKLAPVSETRQTTLGKGIDQW